MDSPETEPVFVRLDEGHAALMHALERECFSLPWSERQCREALAQKSFRAFGLLRGEKLLAYVSVYHACEEMEIVNLAVAPDCRRQGLGKRILAILLQAASKMGIEKVALEARCTNYPALSLYRQAGFTIVGKRKKYYPDTGEDALVLAWTNYDAAKPAGEKSCKR